MLKEKKIGQLWKIVAMTDVINGCFYVIIDVAKEKHKDWTICWINVKGKSIIEEWSSKEMEDDIFISEAVVDLVVQSDENSYYYNKRRS